MFFSDGGIKEPERLEPLFQNYRTMSLTATKDRYTLIEQSDNLIEQSDTSIIIESIIMHSLRDTL